MTHRNALSRLAVAALAATAVAAPAAAAQPLDMDMHASTVHRAPAAHQDLRGEAAADSSRNIPSYPRGSFPGPPVYPTNTTPLTPPKAPAATADTGNDGTDVPIALLVIGGTLIAAGGMAAATVRLRVHAA